MRSTIVPLHGAAIHAVRTPCVRLPSLRRLVSVFSAIPGRVRSRFGPCAQAVGLSSAGLPRRSRFQMKKKKLRSNDLSAWKVVSGLGIQTWWVFQSPRLFPARLILIWDRWGYSVPASRGHSNIIGTQCRSEGLRLQYQHHLLVSALE